MAESAAKPVSSFAWSAVEGAGLSVISFLSLVAFSRVLSPSDFGLFATALSLFELLSLISNLAFHDALVQVPRMTPQHRDTAFTLTVLVSILFTASFVLGAPLFSMVMDDPKAGAILAVLGVSFFLNGLSATLTAQQRRHFQFKTLALRSLIGRVSGAMLGLVAAYYGFGVWSLVIQQVAIALLSTLVLWLACEDRPRFGLNGPVARELITFGVGAAGAEFVNSGIKRLFVMACGILLSTTVAGYINLAFRLVDTLWGVAASAIYQVVLPMMSRLQDDRPRLVALFFQAQRYTALLLYAAFMMMAATADNLVTLLFGDKWLPAAFYVQLLCFTMLLQAPRMLAVPILTAIGRPRDVLFGYSWGVLYMVVMLALVPLASGSAAMAIWAGTELVYAPVFIWALWRRTRITGWQQLQNIAWASVAGGVMFGLAAGVHHAMPTGTSWAPIVDLVCSGLAGTFGFVAVLAVFDRPTLVLALQSIGHFLPQRWRPASRP
jgi:PST family polysaccharide transporter